jgi:hypothetical protein
LNFFSLHDLIDAINYWRFILCVAISTGLALALANYSAHFTAPFFCGTIVVGILLGWYWDCYRKGAQL